MKAHMGKFNGLTASLLVIALAGCASPLDRVVLLPNADGSSSAVVVKTAAGEKLINKPYDAVNVDNKGVISPKKETPDSVHTLYGAVLEAQPMRPVSYIAYFISGKNEITAESKAVVENMKTELMKRNVPEIVVIGHTDRVGKVEANDVLSLERAKIMRDILVAGGVPATSIEVAGRGEREPLVPTDDEIEEPRNRRVEINVR